MSHLMKPTPYFFISLLFWLLLSVLAIFHVIWLFYWVVFGSILFLFALYDLWQVSRLPHLKAQRQVAGSLALNVQYEVTLIFHNTTQLKYVINVFDDYPVECDFKGLLQRLTLPAKSSVEMRYHIQPQQRGKLVFNGIFVFVQSPWSLWQYKQVLPVTTTIYVYPNFAEVTKYALFAIENRLGQLGIRQLQRRGEGLEFHQLREYRTGDSLRQISWTATSRLKKLISKEYQDERDQRVVFLLDCGRRMLAKDGQLSHFDHALNAILLLSYVALRQGDALGLLTFSGEQRWLAPRKGLDSLNRILNTVYDLQPSLHTSDYLNAATQLIARHNRRSLIVVVSNLRDEDSDELLPALKLLRKKHLVLLASLQENSLTEVLNQPIHHFKDALRHASMQTYLNQREKAHEALHQHGIIYIDTLPEQLPVEMVNRYLEIKKSGRL